jgi:hypothetical protein
LPRSSMAMRSTEIARAISWRSSLGSQPTKNTNRHDGATDTIRQRIPL